MKIHMYLFFALFIFTTSCKAQNDNWKADTNDNSTTERVYKLSDFQGVSASSGIDVELTEGSQFHVIAKVKNPDHLDALDVEVSNNVLKLGIKRGTYKNMQIKFYITMPYLEKIDISSGSSLKLTNEFSSKNMEIDVSSGASFNGAVNVDQEVDIDLSSGSSLNLSLNAKDLKADVSSGASCVLKGKADSAEFDASSGATISAKGMQINEIEAEAGGGASIRIPDADRMIINSDISSNIN